MTVYESGSRQPKRWFAGKNCKRLAYKSKFQVINTNQNVKVFWIWPPFPNVAAMGLNEVLIFALRIAANSPLSDDMYFSIYNVDLTNWNGYASFEIAAIF